jgi:low temperature requirement protein LtrA
MFLFIDLVLVALTSKCAQVMEYCALSAHTFLFASIVFTVMFLTRQHLDEYCNRFYANDLFHRLCYFFYVGAFFVMALNVNSWPNHSHLDWKCASNLYGVGFGVAYCMTRGIMCMLYLGVMYDEPEKAVEQFTGPLVRNILVITITVILMFCETQAMSVGNKGPFPPANRMYIYLIATFLEWGYDVFHNVVLAFKKTGVDVHPVFVCLEYYPLNLVVYQERLGAFIMLVLGESMICLLVPYFDMAFASQTYSFHCISYCIIFCYGIMYYDSSNHGATEDTHAVNHSLLSNFLYFWLHVFVGLAVFMTSASMGILYLKEVASDGTHRRRLGEEGLLFEDAQTYNAGGFRALSFGHGRMLGGHDDGRSDKTLYPPEDDLSAPCTFLPPFSSFSCGYFFLTLAYPRPHYTPPHNYTTQ